MKCKKCGKEFKLIFEQPMDHWYFYCPDCGYLNIGVTVEEN